MPDFWGKVYSFLREYFLGPFHLQECSEEEEAWGGNQRRKRKSRIGTSLTAYPTSSICEESGESIY